MDFRALFHPKTADADTHHQSASHNPSAVSVTRSRGATNAVSSVSRQLGKNVNNNIEAGIEYGVGISHGLGAGFGGMGSVIHKTQLCVLQTMGRMMIKFGIVGSPFGELPSPSFRNTVASVMKMSTNLSPYNGNGSQTEKVMKLKLKQQQVIEELMEENEKVRQIVVEDMTKLQTNSSRRKCPCCECIECRRKQRRIKVKKGS